MTRQITEEEFLKLRHDSELRLQAFYDHWPASKDYLSKEEFVRQGFYCVGQGDRVRCTYCRGNLSDWEPSDDILLEHKKHFSKCPFIASPYKYPEFRDFSSRLESFSDWPTQFSQKKEDLAQAGMFYLGKYRFCNIYCYKQFEREMLYTGKYSPLFYFSHLLPSSAGKFKTRQIPVSQITSF